MLADFVGFFKKIGQILRKNKYCTKKIDVLPLIITKANNVFSFNFIKHLL